MRGINEANMRQRSEPMEGRTGVSNLALFMWSAMRKTFRGSTPGKGMKIMASQDPTEDGTRHYCVP